MSVVNGCGFELQNLCSWQNVTTDTSTNSSMQQYWKIYTGDDADLNHPNFPHFDHTLFSPYGHFLLADMNENITKDGKARIISKKFGENIGPQCLSFFWKYLGNARLSLNVIMQKGNEDLILWNPELEVSEFDWSFTQVDIYDEGSFQLIFEALKLAESGSGTLNLDDIDLSPNSCPPKGSCDFTTDSCGYTNVPLDGIPWLTGTGKTHRPDIITGPQESAESSGLYAYMDFTQEALGTSTGGFGRMISPQLEPTDQNCFSFWFNIFGHRPGSLRVQKVIL